MHSNGDKSMGLGKVKSPDFIAGKAVFGQIIDHQTRCTHYHSSADIIAIRFRCCDRYYPCFECHSETAGHEAKKWPKDEYGTKAILCGVCGYELTIDQYLGSKNVCPECASAFNPNCQKHYHVYFDI